MHWGHVSALESYFLAYLSAKPLRLVPCCLQYELVLPGPVQLVTLGRNMVVVGLVADETLLGRSWPWVGRGIQLPRDFGRAAGSNLERKPHLGQSSSLNCSATSDGRAELPETA